MTANFPRFRPAMAMLLPAILLSGCATAAAGDYPSLARRAVELRGQAPANRPDPEMPPPPVTVLLPAAITALQADAERGQAAFAAALPAAQSRVAAAQGAAAGSEPWFIAQASLSVLDNARASSTLALAEIDRLTAAATFSNAAGGADSLVAAQSGIAEMVAAQTATIDALLRALAPTR